MIYWYFPFRFELKVLPENKYKMIEVIDNYTFLSIDGSLCFRSARSSIQKDKLRASMDDVLMEFPSRSLTACSSACLGNWRCRAYNFMSTTCKLYSTTALEGDLSTQNQSVYFEWDEQDQEMLKVCNWHLKYICF